MYSALGDQAQALEYYEQALPFAPGGRQGRRGPTLNNIGLAYAALGDKAQALQYYEQALPLRRQVGDKGGEATTLNNIGVVYDALGDKAQALQYYEQALPLRRQVGDKGGEATTLNNIGGVYDALGDKAQALQYYEQALPLRRQVGDKGGEATTLNNIGVSSPIYDGGAPAAKAADRFRQVIQVFHDLGAVAEEAAVMANLAQLLQIGGGDQAEAAQWMESSIAILGAPSATERDAMGQTLAEKQALLTELTGQSPVQPEGQARELTLDQLLAFVSQARTATRSWPSSSRHSWSNWPARRTLRRRSRPWRTSCSSFWPARPPPTCPGCRSSWPSPFAKHSTCQSGSGYPSWPVRPGERNDIPTRSMYMQDAHPISAATNKEIYHGW